MAVLGFSHFNLKAERPLLAALRDFYRDVVGLHDGARPPFPAFGYWLYAGNEAVLHLIEAPAGVGLPTAPESNFDHVAFACSGRDATKTRLAAAGVPFRERAIPGAAIVQLFLHDPAGNGVELNFVD